MKRFNIALVDGSVAVITGAVLHVRDRDVILVLDKNQDPVFAASGWITAVEEGAESK